MTGARPTTSWPLSRLGEALHLLAVSSGLPVRAVDMPASPQSRRARQSDAIDAWLRRATASLGLEASAVDTLYTEIPTLIRTAAPALVMLPGPGEPRFLALLRSDRKRVVVLGEDHRAHRLSPERARQLLCHDIEAPLVAEAERLLAAAGVSERRRPSARAAIVREHLGGSRVSNCWLLRLPAGASFWRQLRQVRLTHRLAAFVAAHIAQLALLILSWRIIGNGALEGRLDLGWLLAWALTLFALVPVRMLMVWWRGAFAVGFGQLLKQRLLCGALRLDAHEVRHQGVGQLLGRVIESEVLGASVLSAALAGLVAVVELCVGGAVLALGAGGTFHVLLLVAWAGLTGTTAWLHLRRAADWTASRLDMTHDLVERMVGYRTRLAQQAVETWHVEEDHQTQRYHSCSTRMDRIFAQFSVWVFRGWHVVGFVGLVPAFVAGSASITTLAIGLGGVLLASQALATLTNSLATLSLAAVAWRQVEPLFHAAARPEQPGAPEVPLSTPGQPGERPVIEGQRLTFRFRERGEPVLRACGIRVRPGERVMVEGASGSGKSTLASILAGIRRPDSGLVLLENARPRDHPAHEQRPQPADQRAESLSIPGAVPGPAWQAPRGLGLGISGRCATAAASQNRVRGRGTGTVARQWDGSEPHRCCARRRPLRERLRAATDIWHAALRRALRRRR